MEPQAELPLFLHCALLPVAHCSSTIAKLSLRSLESPPASLLAKPLATACVAWSQAAALLPPSMPGAAKGSIAMLVVALFALCACHHMVKNLSLCVVELARVVAVCCERGLSKVVAWLRCQ